MVKSRGGASATKVDEVPINVLRKVTSPRLAKRKHGACRFIKQIGKGASGEVFLCEVTFDTGIKACAIKQFHKDDFDVREHDAVQDTGVMNNLTVVHTTAMPLDANGKLKWVLVMPLVGQYRPGVQIWSAVPHILKNTNDILRRGLVSPDIHPCNLGCLKGRWVFIDTDGIVENTANTTLIGRFLPVKQPFWHKVQTCTKHLPDEVMSVLELPQSQVALTFWAAIATTLQVSVAPDVHTYNIWPERSRLIKAFLAEVTSNCNKDTKQLFIDMLTQAGPKVATLHARLLEASDAAAQRIRQQQTSTPPLRAAYPAQ